MDKNKFDKLIEIGYKIKPCCDLCKYGKFHNDDWGDCAKHIYKHLKHTADYKQLSIYRFGYCDYFIADDLKISFLNMFKGFFNDNT